MEERDKAGRALTCKAVPLYMRRIANAITYMLLHAFYICICMHTLIGAHISILLILHAHFVSMYGYSYARFLSEA